MYKTNNFSPKTISVSDSDKILDLNIKSYLKDYVETLENLGNRRRKLKCLVSDCQTAFLTYNAASGWNNIERHMVSHTKILNS